MGLLLGQSAAHKAWHVVIVGIVAHLNRAARKLKVWQLLPDEPGRLFASAALFGRFFRTIRVFDGGVPVSFDHAASFQEFAAFVDFCLGSGLLSGAEGIDELLYLSWLNV